MHQLALLPSRNSQCNVKECHTNKTMQHSVINAVIKTFKNTTDVPRKVNNSEEVDKSFQRQYQLILELNLE